MMKKLTFLAAMLLSILCHAEEAKNILLIAGKPSHGPGAHEHNAGTLLLKKCLDESGLPVKSTMIRDGGWPSPEQLAAADTVLIYCDGGGVHVILKDDRMQQLAKEMKRGCGIICLHYAVEIPKNKGGAELLGWMGGAADVIVGVLWGGGALLMLGLAVLGTLAVRTLTRRMNASDQPARGSATP